VRDHGPGVPADERARVFERFARGREAEAVPGSGLGLAIVAQVAADHGGRAWLDAPADGGSGTVATLDLSPARFSADSQRTPRATFKDGAEPGPVADPGHASPPATPPEPPRSTP
ncbi:MAG: sensor histidine kinase, partial [Acidimicrobiales bacterium]|nr:sensor histidine kinase [Acidimicrobiales bacterium]